MNQSMIGTQRDSLQIAANRLYCMQKSKSPEEKG
jgi:hypothetical protein